MTEPELYTQPSKEERRRMNEAMARIEAGESSRKPAPNRKAASSRRRNKRRSTGNAKRKAKLAVSVEEDNTTFATLDASEWRAMVRVLPSEFRVGYDPMQKQLATRVRGAILSKTQGVSGPVQIAGTVDGFSALLGEFLKIEPKYEPAGFSEAARLAADLSAQVSKNMNWEKR